jgi:hypothetical protein
MFGSFFSGLKAENTNEQFSTRRRFSRRSCDSSVAMIGDQIYPVENWSMGGLAIQGDTRQFGVDETVAVTLKFKLSDGVVDLPHQARIVRKTAERVALEFEPLTSAVRKGMQSVIDDYVSSRFAESQLVS